MSAGLQKALNLKHFESARSLIKATAGRVAYRFMNKTHACFWKWVFPSASSHPPTVEPCSHSPLSLTAFVSNTIKSRGKKYSSTYHELSHRTHINTHNQRTTHTHQENGCYYWFLGWCVRRCTNTEAWLQKVFLSFKSYNRSATAGRWLPLYLDSRSIQLWDRQKCCIAPIVTLSWATPATSYRAHALRDHSLQS